MHGLVKKRASWIRSWAVLRLKINKQIFSLEDIRGDKEERKYMRV